MSKLNIVTLDGLKITVNDKRVDEVLSKKAKGLLVYLISTKNEVSREKLAELFWEDCSITSARNNLRHVIWEINKLCPNEIISRNNENCKISSKIHVESDIVTLESIYNEYQSTNIEILKKNIQCYKNDFLDGIYFKNVIAINDWLMMRRNYLQRIYYEIISYIGDFLLEQKDYNQSLTYYERLLKINPLHEEIYLKLMRNCVEAQEITHAIKYYKICSDHLRNELNIDPGEELQDLYFRIIGERNSMKANGEQQNSQVSSNIQIRIDGESEFHYELCCRLIDLVIDYIQLEKLTEDESYNISYLGLLHPSSKFQTHNPIDAFQKEPFIFIAMAVMFKLLNDVNVQIFIHNIERSDEKSKGILKALARHISYKGNLTLVLN